MKHHHEQIQSYTKFREEEELNSSLYYSPSFHPARNSKTTYHIYDDIYDAQPTYIYRKRKNGYKYAVKVCKAFIPICFQAHHQIPRVKETHFHSQETRKVIHLPNTKCIPLPFSRSQDGIPISDCRGYRLLQRGSNIKRDK